MSTTTSIEWCDRTWNPTRGCARVSSGCEHCFAERQAHRFSADGQPYEGLTVLGKHGPRWTGRARFVPEMLDAPLRWKKPQRVFVNSMSDLFHEHITNEQIAAVFGVMAAAPQHTFQVLTKRPQRMLAWFKWLRAWAEREKTWPGNSCCKQAAQMHTGRVARIFCVPTPDEWPLPNVWLGVSVENQQRADERIPLLRRSPAAVHFVSAEPLLGPVTFDDRWLEWLPLGPDENNEAHLLPPLRWVIVGGESGPGARRCEVSWIRDIVAQCNAAGVACFVKQLGARPWANRVDEHPGRLADRKGGDMEEWPNDLRVREFPEARA